MKKNGQYLRAMHILLKMNVVDVLCWVLIDFRKSSSLGLMGEGFILLTRGYGFIGGGVPPPPLTR